MKTHFAKKILVVLLAAVMVFSFAACGGGNLKDIVSQLTVDFQSGDTKDSVTKDISLKSLSDESIKVTWTSSEPAVIAIDGNKGRITRPAADTQVTLTVTAESGNKKESKPYIVNVKKSEETSTLGDKTAPIINGAHHWMLTYGLQKPNWLSGVTAIDTVDGEVSVYVDDSQVDLSKTGTYTLTYNAADKAGNKAEIAVTVAISKTIITGTQTYYFLNPVKAGYKSGETMHMDTYANGSFTYWSADPQYGTSFVVGSDAQLETLVIELSNMTSAKLDFGIAPPSYTGGFGPGILINIPGYPSRYVTTKEEFEAVFEDENIHILDGDVVTIEITAGLKWKDRIEVKSLIYRVDSDLPKYTAPTVKLSQSTFTVADMNDVDWMDYLQITEKFGKNYEITIDDSAIDTSEGGSNMPLKVTVKDYKGVSKTTTLNVTVTAE